jgi:hypothetical protein
MNEARVFALGFGYIYKYSLCNLLILTASTSLTQLDSDYYTYTYWTQCQCRTYGPSVPKMGGIRGQMLRRQQLSPIGRRAPSPLGPVIKSSLLPDLLHRSFLPAFYSSLSPPSFASLTAGLPFWLAAPPPPGPAAPGADWLPASNRPSPPTFVLSFDASSTD